MNVKPMSAEDVLAQMRALRAAAKRQPMQVQDVTGVDKVQKPQFTNVLTDAIDNVNALQKESASLSKRLEMGDDKVSLAQVMIASQKSSVAFQATLQVRNKLVDAYKEVMNMPV